MVSYEYHELQIASKRCIKYLEKIAPFAIKDCATSTIMKLFPSLIA